MCLLLIHTENAPKIPTIGEAPSENGNITVRPAALDAYRVFHDICALTEGQSPRYLQFRSLPQSFGLELIESVLTNHPDIFLSHPEQAQILRRQVAPLVMKAITDRLSFPTTVRVTRVLYILLRRHLSILSEECEHALSQLTQMLEPDNSQSWKRALCMEVFRGLCAEPALIRKIFSTYDAQESKRPIIKTLVGALARLTQEKPSLIGLGTQSSIPIGQQAQKDSSEQAALEAGGVAGIIGGAVGLGEVTATGLSTQWSLVRVPCIDQLDKSEPPAIPESYIYCLTLTCINSFSEGLAKFVLPIAGDQDVRKRLSRTASIGTLLAPAGTGSDSESVDSPARTPSPTKSMSKRRPTKRTLRVSINLLSLDSHPLYGDIKICAAIIEACWPAVLAACSTFLYATLDNDLYHALVRGFQKFTQVAGLLRLTTPRDAFLTTLGKAAVPANVVSANLSSSPATSSASTSGDHSLFANAKGFLGVESGGSGYDRPPTISSENQHRNPLSLNSRNLLCLRALLNLGIVLGPTLEASWTIILETLQRADYVLFASSRRSGRQLSLSGSSMRSETQRAANSTESELMANIGPELSAVEVAAAKMFDGTRDFPDEAFVHILFALCKLLSSFDSMANGRASIDKPLSPTRSTMPRSPATHKRTSSVGSISVASQVIGDNAFALAKIDDLAQINMARIIGPNPTATGWDLLVSHLVTITSSRDTGSSIRMKAAEVLYDIVVSAAKAVSTENTENVTGVQRRILDVLKQCIEEGNRTGQTDSATRAIELEIHRAGLEALNAILEHAGQSLIAGWEIVFEIIASVFDATMVWTRDTKPHDQSSSHSGRLGASQRSTRLIRTSFSSLELICSDFLTSLPTSCVLVLVDALFAFSSQKDDLNISLTTITFFWNVSDFLQSKGDYSTKGDMLTGNAESEKDLLEIVERTDADSHSALWMLLLLRLTGVSKDSRAEVRNGEPQAHRSTPKISGMYAHTGHRIDTDPFPDLRYIWSSTWSPRLGLLSQDCRL